MAEPKDEVADEEQRGFGNGRDYGKGTARKEGVKEVAAPEERRRDWRRIDHSPLFWLAVLLCLAAITIYVLSNDLSWRPRLHH